MKISKVSIKNCLGIKEIEFSPADVTLIEGKSKSGKTSIIDSIVQFLTNNGERPNFVHENAKNGEVLIEFDNGLKGRKLFKADGKPSTVSIEKDGMQPKGAETFLKTLFNSNQINPISFISKSAKEQTEIILNAVPMILTEENIVSYFGENLIEDAENQHALKVLKILESKYFDLRKESNSQLKYLKSDIELIGNKIPTSYEVEKWRNVNLSEIITKINNAAEQNKYIVNCQKIIDDAENQKAIISEKAKSEIDLINEKIAQLQEKITEVKYKQTTDCDFVDERVSKSKDWLKDKTEIDVSPLQTELQETEKMKSYVSLADDLNKKQKWLADEEEKNAEYANKLAIARALPAELIQGAKLPVEDMGINENGEITVKGRPIMNLSGAERLDFATNIAKLTCGELKTILINGFEALDSEMKKQFIENASKDTAYQYIIADVADCDLQIK